MAIILNCMLYTLFMWSVEHSIGGRGCIGFDQRRWGGGGGGGRTHQFKQDDQGGPGNVLIILKLVYSGVLCGESGL